MTIFKSILCLAVFFNRIQSGCHTIFQTVSGGVFGITMQYILMKNIS
jgi:hypothetical protein